MSGSLSRSRWAAVGAAVAIVAGAGGATLIARAATEPTTPSSFVPITPCRLIDTRGPENVGPRAVAMGPAETYVVTVWGANGNCTIPATATAVTMNVVSVEPTAPSFLSIYPADKAWPGTSSLNWIAGQAATPNAVTSPLSADGRLALYNLAGTVHVVADIVGYYGPYQVGNPPTPDLNRVAQLNWYGGPYSGGSYGFNGPWGVAFDGTHLWITNHDGDSVTEINAADGSWVRTLSGGSYGFNNPTAVAFDGTHLWITNGAASSVTEINAADGSWVRTLAGNPYAFNQPYGVAFDGTYIWVANALGNSVTQIDAENGAAVRILAGGSFGFNSPNGMAFDGAHLWVTNRGGNTVTEINTATGAWMRTLTGASYGFNDPYAVAFDGAHIWVTNGSGNTVTEIDAANGTWVRTLSGAVYGFSSPWGMAFDGTRIWVANAATDSVTPIRTG